MIKLVRDRGVVKMQLYDNPATKAVADVWFCHIYGGASGSMKKHLPSSRMALSTSIL